jgi:hypothetical protein
MFKEALREGANARGFYRLFTAAACARACGFAVRNR